MVVRRKPKLIVILGPTASGKTGWSIKLAKKYGGYIISADSRQVYKGMDLATDKIKKKDRQGIKHYLLDVVEPGQDFNVAKYQKMVNQIIAKHSDQLPFLVGGTGLYIEAVVNNYKYPKQGPELYETLQIGIKKDRQELYKKIDRRAKEHWEQGLEKEVKGLIKKYDSRKIKKMGFGYKQAVDYWQGTIDKTEAIRQHQRDTRRYARRQITWFKRDDRIKWVKNYSQANKLIREFIKK